MGDSQFHRLPCSKDEILCEGSLPVSDSDEGLISDEAWDRAEQTAKEVVFRIQPTLGADQKRKEITEYVQRLIGYGVGCEVLSYGSVPLKTYVPDGDIDLTVCGGQNDDDVLVSDVHAILRGEEHNEAAPFEVKDVHCIDAEVKLVKCIVEDIVVDISFNQLGGLSTLRFLEQVDRHIGKNHLFKRSIILVKAWCYYESRILGSHHGLISTYALETLVLYIFQMFHTSLTGPTAVLYKFLEYFSRFDWENYCISLKGPVCKSSFPRIAAEEPENGMNDPLLSDEFLRTCVDMFSVSSMGFETDSRAFPLKHLNIIDPLKENNNLGRSVNRANFYRIRSAFKYGACNLGQVLLLPMERMVDELKKFFSNTLDRHASIFLTKVQHFSLASGGKVFECFPSPSLSPSPSPSPLQFLHNVHNLQRNRYGVASRPQWYPANNFNPPCAASGEENMKPRGTGTYFPMRCRSYSGRRFPDRKNRLHEIHVSWPRLSYSYSMPATPQGFNWPANSGREFSQAEFPVLGYGRFGSSPYYHQSNLSVSESSHTSAFSCPSERLERGSSWPENSVAEPFPEGNNYTDFGSSNTLSRSQSPVESTIQKSESSSSRNLERVEEQSYHLKDEDDFPPLSISASLKMLTC